MDSKTDQLTLVTFYFDLSSREETRMGVGRKYLTLGNYILDLDVNLFIVADPRIAVHAWNQRKKRNLLNKTFIIPIALENLPYYSHRPAIEQAFAAGKRPIGLSIKKDTPLYFLLGWSKFWALQQSIKLNPFQSKIFAWVDYGLFHLWPNQEEQMKLTLSDNLAQLISGKIKVTTMNETSQSEIIDRSLFYSKRQCKMISGYFGGGKELMEWFCEKFDQELKCCLKSGHPNLEESIMSVIYAENKDKFISYHGDYVDLISYHPRKLLNLEVMADKMRKPLNLEVMADKMRKLRDLKMWDKMVGIYYQTIKYVDLNEPSISIYDQLSIYNETLVAGWYADRKNISLEAANRLVKLINTNPQIHDHISWGHYNMNLTFHNLKVERATNTL